MARYQLESLELAAPDSSVLLLGPENGLQIRALLVVSNSQSRQHQSTHHSAKEDRRNAAERQSTSPNPGRLLGLGQASGVHLAT